MMSMRLVQHNCSYEALRPVVEAGATVKHAYLRADNSQIGVVTVAREICGL